MYISFFFLMTIHRIMIREVDIGGAGDGWSIASVLFGRKMFYLSAILVFLSIVTVGLVALFLEQTINITKNQVINTFYVSFHIVSFCADN
jgi:hypothetical protein